MEEVCKLCNGTLEIDVLNVWKMNQDSVAGRLASYDSVRALPMLRAPCPECCGEAACTVMMKSFKDRWGEPYAPSHGDPSDE